LQHSKLGYGKAFVAAGQKTQERSAHPRETNLAALRGEVLPERMPVEGLLILHDGEPGEPEVTLSPLPNHYQHRAEIEAVVQGADRDAAFDRLTGSIGMALATDRTLGGL